MTGIRLATSEDAQAIADLMRSGMEPGWLDMTIFGCHGIADFLRAHLDLRPSLRDTQNLVALDGNTIVGYLELKYAGTRVFLNHICTSGPARGNGIAGLLLQEGVILAQHAGQREMLLDVFHDNRQARSWYCRLGFVPQGGTGWWHIPLKMAETGQGGRISGYAHAVAASRCYGFSSFSMATAKAVYTIGKLGTKWFRTADAGLLEDGEALACLARLEHGRSILGLFPLNISCKNIPDARRMHTAERMSASLDTLLDALAARRLIT